MGPAGMEDQVDLTRLRSRRRDKVHQKLRQQARNRFGRIPPRLDDLCAHTPQDLPADNAVRRFWTSPHNRPFTGSPVHLQLCDHLVDARHLLGDDNKSDDDDPAFEASLLRPLPSTPGHSG